MLNVYRYGHRPLRDKRITTHIALTSRAFGVEGMAVDTYDPELESTISRVNKEFGGNFIIKTGVTLNEYMSLLGESLLVHLTMYGIPVMDKIEEIKSKNSKILVFVGAEKVPPEIYQKADFNISVTSQPISELSALTVFLDRYYEGKELNIKFEGKRKIIPSERGKNVIVYDD